MTKRIYRQPEQNGLTEAMVDRLRLTHDRIDGMAPGIATADRPPRSGGRIDRGKKEAANGLQIRKVRTPIGVIGIIYESRPNVTIDCAGLCLKSGNACHPYGEARKPCTPTGHWPDIIANSALARRNDLPET